MTKINRTLCLINKYLKLPSITFACFLLLGFVLFFEISSAYSQNIYQPNYSAQIQPNNSYLANSSAFRQEVARLEINVVRQGNAPLSITQVPRLEKNDILKVRLLDEPVNGIKIDQTNFDWTLLVAFINPARNSESPNSVSDEIQFRKSGWYKEYSFAVPYDSQPVFFLYPKPNYREKILGLIVKNKDDIRKIGEKTIEISTAYAKIGSFLSELQSVVNQNQYYRSYSGYSNYSNYGINSNYNKTMLMEQAVERLAKGFNIQLPACWQNGSSYNGANNYNAGMYNGNYNAGMYNGMGNAGYNNIYNDFAGRVQCVAKSVRVEDLDLSISQMLQQGGILAVSQLAQKYPQIAFWINIAAAAVDFILQMTQKTPLKLVPTVNSSTESQMTMLPPPPPVSAPGLPAQMQNGPQINYSSNLPQAQPNQVKISLYAESSPRVSGFVTVYPLVVHKWQAEAEPATIDLSPPTLMETCLHQGQNILRSTDLLTDWINDNYTKDFRLDINSADGFHRQFALRKNSGLSGWELNLTNEDLDSLAKNKGFLEAVMTGKRGFSSLQTAKFGLSVESPAGGPTRWEIDPQVQKSLLIGGKKTVTLRNQLGGCRCLQAIAVKSLTAADKTVPAVPAADGSLFEASTKSNTLRISDDGKEASFEIDTSNFKPGTLQLELRNYSGAATTMNINLYPAPPSIMDLKLAKGDRGGTVKGERLEQIRALKINGKRAVFSAVSAQNALSPNQRAFVFEDKNYQQNSNSVSVEMELDGNRVLTDPKKYSVSLARPAVVTDKFQQIEGIVVFEKLKPTPAAFNAISRSRNNIAAPLVETIEKLTVNFQNALVDYDFNQQNIQIEVRFGNGEIAPGQTQILPPPFIFTVVDWKTARINFEFNEQGQQILAGNKLQFRIHDRQRGDSDWYTVKKTFPKASF